MTSKIFFNYRREDDPSAAGRLFDQLEQAFGADELFMDVDSIAPGLDFVKELDDQVAQCDVVLAVIGRAWLQSADDSGQRRLDNPADFVRIEIESALKRDKRVIPVLVNEAQMPSADDLPETLKPLARRHAVRLSHDSFRPDSERLVKALKSALAEEANKREQLAQQQHEARKRQEAEEAAQRQAEEEQRRREARPQEAEEQAERERQAAPPRRAVDRPVSGNRRRWLLGGGAALAAIAVGVVAILTIERSYGPGETFRDCAECPEMVVIPAGAFLMGSPEKEAGRSNNEGPLREVTISAFAIGRYEVTFPEWDACVAAGSCSHEPEDAWGRGRQPVMRVSWNDAQEYVGWLSEKTGERYRLPSEAEWEYAARAGTTTRYAFGDEIAEAQANFGTDKTTGVGSYPANSWGLHDMHGNVWEWVEDCSRGNYDSAPTDGTAWLQGDCSARVLRGGSWGSKPEGLRSASRYYGFRPDFRNGIIGFRVARTL